MEFMKLEDMTIEQKIGHLIVARGFIDEEDAAYILEMVKKRCLGGYQYVGDKNRSVLGKEILKIADYPVLIYGDMEAGYGEARYPAHMGVGASDDPKMANLLARATAVCAKRDGVNFACAVVAEPALKGDLTRNGRSFSDDPEKIADFAVEMIKGYQQEGMIVTLKHYPSPDDSLGDSHMKKTVSHLTKEDLLKRNLVPYVRAMKEADLTAIMTGHPLMAEIDDVYISSLSKKVIDIIREQGFDGLIVTDSLAMMAIAQNYGKYECLATAINAGNDMVLPNYRLTYKESFEALLKSYKDGVISDERLNEAVSRVLRAQKQAQQPATTTVLTDEMKEALEQANQKCICGIYKEGYTAKLDPDTKKLFVLLCENQYNEPGELTPEIQMASPRSRQSMEKKKEEILQMFPGSEVLIINEFPNFTENEKVCYLASETDETIFYTFCKMGAYLGSDSITERIANLIDANMDKISAIIHVGSPYEIEKFKDAKRIITSPSQGKCEEYMLKALKGEFTPTGKIPVKLD
ncbi:MAG: glycoside hydrolase family 3 protein [Clostridia bacterium]|nr:glycoside hydrolase family 3 protein [Clostridia bacterium]